MSKEAGNILYIFTYLFSWLSGLVIFVTEGQNNKRMKFHSLQAIFLGITAVVVNIVLFFIPFLGSFLAFLIWLYGMYVAIEAYEGKDVNVPLIGDYATKYSNYK